MKRDPVYTVVVGVRLPEWAAEGLDKLRGPTQTRSEWVRNLVCTAILNDELEE